jgi:hypothetical protein
MTANMTAGFSLRRSQLLALSQPRLDHCPPGIAEVASRSGTRDIRLLPDVGLPAALLRSRTASRSVDLGGDKRLEMRR